MQNDCWTLDLWFYMVVWTKWNCVILVTPLLCFALVFQWSHCWLTVALHRENVFVTVTNSWVHLPSLNSSLHFLFTTFWLAVTQVLLSDYLSWRALGSITTAAFLEWSMVCGDLTIIYADSEWFVFSVSLGQPVWWSLRLLLSASLELL